MQYGIPHNLNETEVENTRTQYLFNGPRRVVRATVGDDCSQASGELYIRTVVLRGSVVFSHLNIASGRPERTFALVLLSMRYLL
jgi:hypothetical protein